MNQKENGQKLEGYEIEFMKFIVGHHARSEEKLKDFDHFTVDEHSEFKGTRCFFVVRAGGEKEDFSLGKCIEAMEAKALSELKKTEK